MEEQNAGCAPPAGQVEEIIEEEIKQEEGGKQMTIARVGAKAPQFSAPAYKKGKFININLSDYLGKWVMVCFYPGDFTFV